MKIDKLIRCFIKYNLVFYSKDKLVKKSISRAVRTFSATMKTSIFYKDILQRFTIPVEIKNEIDFKRFVPIISKKDVFGKYKLNELMHKNSDVSKWSNILTSSGHGKTGYAFSITYFNELNNAKFNIDFGLDLIFKTDKKSTLIVNCLPMGVYFQSSTVCVANVSVREDMAHEIILKAGPLFNQVILVADPLFTLNFIDFFLKQENKFNTKNLHIILGEETFSESYRKYIKLKLNLSSNAIIGSSFGIAELGLNLFNETKETIELREKLYADIELCKIILGFIPETMPTFLVYNPLRIYIEVLDTNVNNIGELCITSLDQNAMIPLIRYRTGDKIKTIDKNKVKEHCSIYASPLFKVFPIIALFGREEDELSESISVDWFKEFLFKLNYKIVDCLTGAFKLKRTSEESIKIEIQLKKDIAIVKHDFEIAILKELEKSKPEVNFEIIIYDYFSFPYGMTLDYERKFNYV